LFGRAPFFEVQTDVWECFCAIHWDPSHADCAVPQVKYINSCLVMKVLLFNAELKISIFFVHFLPICLTKLEHKILCWSISF